MPEYQVCNRGVWEDATLCEIHAFGQVHVYLMSRARPRYGIYAASLGKAIKAGDARLKPATCEIAGLLVSREMQSPPPVQQTSSALPVLM